MLFWIIFIIFIVFLMKKNQKDQQEEVQEKISDKDLKTPVKNSYYTKEKIERYQQMEKDHSCHEEEDLDLSSKIGYKRCPQCHAIISKTSDICFMCDYHFENNQKKIEKN